MVLLSGLRFRVAASAAVLLLWSKLEMAVAAAEALFTMHATAVRVHAAACWRSPMLSNVFGGTLTVGMHDSPADTGVDTCATGLESHVALEGFSGLHTGSGLQATTRRFFRMHPPAAAPFSPAGGVLRPATSWAAVMELLHALLPLPLDETGCCSPLWLRLGNTLPTASAALVQRLRMRNALTV